MALRRLELCAYAVQEIHTELNQPNDSEEKADLILATEKLVGETVDLYSTVRRYVWGEEEDELGFVHRSRHSDDEDEEDGE